MNISDFILETTGQERKLEPTNSEYSMINTGGVELEVGEFIYGLIRMIKPNNVCETGTHKGVGSSYIGLALSDNGKGHLDTIEFDSQFYDEDYYMWDSLGISNYITLHQMRVEDFDLSGKKFDIIFLDTEPQLRFNELLKFWDNLKPGGIVLIHDLGVGMGQTGVEVNGQMDWPFGTLPDEIKKLIKTKELQCLHFSTPRGLFVAQRRREDFYSNKI